MQVVRNPEVPRTSTDRRPWLRRTPRPERRISVRPAVEPLNLAVVGYGYWGPNLVRNVMEAPDLSLTTVCERDATRAAACSTRVRDVPVTDDLRSVLEDPSVDAVVIATPPSTHHALVGDALRAGKHVLVEKPLATTSADAEDLASIAEENGCVLMPGHTFIYSPAVNAVRELIRDDVVGDLHFATSSRMNLGKYQRDGVVCDLAPHDLSILLYWLGQAPTEVAACGSSVFDPDVAETAFLTLSFPGGISANVQLSWLAPRKVRQMIVVGSKRMVQYDDMASDEPVRVYDRGMDLGAPTTFGEHQLVCRSGDVVIPRIEAAEPLGLELADFARAIRTGTEPRSNVRLGLDIVAAIEAATESMDRRGAPVAVASSARIAA